ncbi:MAG: hypothetical protein QXS57_03275 [Candidatus Caldarchaeum sp.]
MIEQVYVDSVDGDYPFKVFRGRVVWRSMSVRFEGVVYQSVGGPNVRASVVEEDVENLKRGGVSEEEIAALELELQQKIIHGEVELDGNR